MNTDETYDAEIAAEAQAARWFDDLRMRSVGIMHIPEWSHLWIGVLLRRYAEECPKGKGLDRYRTLNAWQTLIERQLAASDPEAPEYRDHILDFLQAVDSPWGITYDPPQGKWAIRQVGTLEEDIAFARDEQRKRMYEEQRLREEADRRVLSLQMSKGLSILPS
jgi:hypothetical protein